MCKPYFKPTNLSLHNQCKNELSTIINGYPQNANKLNFVDNFYILKELLALYCNFQ